MHPVAALFGLATVGACVAAWRSASGAAQLLGLSMAVVWACANQLALLRGMHLIALVDLPTALAAYAIWFDERRSWQAWACVLFGFRMPLHVVAAWGGIDWVTYLHTINALFLGALIAISWTGGVSDVVSECILRVRRSRDLLARAASAAAKVAR